MVKRGGIHPRTGRLWWLVVILLLNMTDLQAAEAGPEVSGLQLHRFQGQLVADITLTNLFSSTITATLRSGLPVVIDLALELRSEVHGDHPPVGHLIRTKVTYDVWDDIYFLKRAGRTLTFTDRDKVIDACGRLPGQPLAPLTRFIPGDRVTLLCRVAVNPLSGQEREKMADWLAQTVSGQDDLSSREIRLDLGALINSFFRGGEISDAWGPESNFGPFDLATLKEAMANDTGKQEGDPP
jgi:hypothetical protein